MAPALVHVTGWPAPCEGMWNGLLTQCPRKVLKALFEARFTRWSVLLSLSKGQDVLCCATGPQPEQSHAKDEGQGQATTLNVPCAPSTWCTIFWSDGFVSKQSLTVFSWVLKTEFPHCPTSNAGKYGLVVGQRGPVLLAANGMLSSAPVLRMTKTCGGHECPDSSSDRQNHAAAHQWTKLLQRHHFLLSLSSVVAYSFQNNWRKMDNSRDKEPYSIKKKGLCLNPCNC